MEMVLSPRSGPRRAGVDRGERGLSIIEVLIAAALFLVIALGVAPLFARATMSNQSGADSTAITNLVKTRTEEVFQAIFDSAALTVPAGQT